MARYSYIMMFMIFYFESGKDVKLYNCGYFFEWAVGCGYKMGPM